MDGIIIIDKQKNYTSHDIVAKIKKIFHVKVGHTGTLDPNATGVLPILLGSGTKLSKYLIEHDKIYEVILKLGEKTDTADSEGKIIERKEIDNSYLKKEKTEKVLNSFLGRQQQIPPYYSAIKINGKKLYEYARSGEEVEISPRNIEIYEIGLKNINENNREISFQVHCSKGTYIRSLCEDIAKKLDTVGYMKELNRIKVGKFSIEQAVIISELEENQNNQNFLKKHLLLPQDIFINRPNIILQEKQETLFRNGVKLSYSLEDGIYNIFNSEKNWIGIGVIKNSLLKRDFIP